MTDDLNQVTVLFNDFMISNKVFRSEEYKEGLKEL